MNKLAPKSRIQQKINVFKEGGAIPKYQNAGILKRIYYWRSPDYTKTEDGKQQSFSNAYAAARRNNDKDFWWTDNKGNRNIYNTDFKLILPQKEVKSYKQLRYEYIKALENPDNAGYDEKTDRWTPPTAKGFDKNQIGIGLDMRTNNAVRDFLMKTGRTNNPWLSQEEMVNLQNQSLQYFEDVLDKNAKGIKISDTKRAIAVGLLYHGHGPNLWSNRGNLYSTFVRGSDQDFVNAVRDFYGSNSRAQRHSQFWK